MWGGSVLLSRCELSTNDFLGWWPLGPIAKTYNNFEYCCNPTNRNFEQRDSTVDALCGTGTTADFALLRTPKPVAQCCWGRRLNAAKFAIRRRAGTAPHPSINAKVNCLNHIRLVKCILVSNLEKRWKMQHLTFFKIKMLRCLFFKNCS